MSVEFSAMKRHTKLHSQTEFLPEGSMRILIIGSGGAGKSTLARHLGEKTGLPVHHMDKFFWLPGWVEPDQAEFTDRLMQVTKSDAWIIDGNYNSTLPLRLPYAQAIIYMDFPRTVCLFNVIKRWIINHGSTRPDMAPGCNEKIDLEFLKWIWTFRKTYHQHYVNILNKAGKPVLHFTNHRQVKAFLSSL